MAQIYPTAEQEDELCAARRQASRAEDSITVDPEWGSGDARGREKPLQIAILEEALRISPAMLL